MKKKTTKLRIVLAMSIVFSMILSLAAFPADVSAASNKAARIKVSFNGKEQVNDDDWNQNTYVISTMLPKTSKVKSGMKTSYNVYIPKSLLKKNGDSVLFCMDIILLTYSKKTKSYNSIGSVNKTRWISIEKEGKNVRLGVYNEAKDKTEASLLVKSGKAKTSKYASIKTKGKYYVLTAKDVLGSTYYDYASGKDKKINTKKSYTLISELVIHGDCSKLSGYVYLDAFTVNAVKKQTVTYNKKDYSGAGGYHFGGKDWKKYFKIVSFK